MHPARSLHLPPVAAALQRQYRRPPVAAIPKPKHRVRSQPLPTGSPPGAARQRSSRSLSRRLLQSAGLDGVQLKYPAHLVSPGTPSFVWHSWLRLCTPAVHRRRTRVTWFCLAQHVARVSSTFADWSTARSPFNSSRSWSRQAHRARHRDTERFSTKQLLPSSRIAAADARFRRPRASSSIQEVDGAPWRGQARSETSETAAGWQIIALIS